MIACNLMVRDQMPSRAAIVQAQSELVERLKPRKLILDPEDQCWACAEYGDIERAHIRPRSGGGSVRPSNFFLLCNYCHKHQPDCASARDQEEWLVDCETYILGLARHIQRLKEDLLRLCRNEDEFNEWCSSMGEDKVWSVFAGIKTARCSRETFRANMNTVFRSELRKWLAQKRKS